MPQHLLTDDQRAFLQAPHFAVAATIGANGLPHQTVMWYALDGDDLVLSTPSGSLKHKHLQRDARLSVCIEEGFRYVTLSGMATVDERDPQAARALYMQIGAGYMAGMGGAGGAGRPDPSRLDPKAAELLSRERVTLRLKVDHVHSNGFG